MQTGSKVAGFSGVFPYFVAYEFPVLAISKYIGYVL
jgi:hypothetical protein